MTNNTNMLTPLGENIWLFDGPVITAAAGFHYPTRMALIKLDDGGLFIWSPTKLTPDLRDAVGKLGELRCIIAPNSLHHMHVAEWFAAFPDAKIFGAPGLTGKRPDLKFDGTLGNSAPQEWANQIDQVLMMGNAITTEVVFFHRASGTVLFTDLVQQMPADWYKGWRKIIAKLDLMSENEPQVPRKFRLAFKDRTKARIALDTVLSWPAQRVVMAHGSPVLTEAKAYLNRVFSWLK